MLLTVELFPPLPLSGRILPARDDFQLTHDSSRTCVYKYAFHGSRTVLEGNGTVNPETCATVLNHMRRGTVRMDA